MLSDNSTTGWSTDTPDGNTVIGTMDKPVVTLSSLMLYETTVSMPTTARTISGVTKVGVVLFRCSADMTITISMVTLKRRK